jgi:hypothetical protein
MPRCVDNRYFETEGNPDRCERPVCPRQLLPYFKSTQWRILLESGAPRNHRNPTQRSRRRITTPAASAKGSAGRSPISVAGARSKTPK